MKSKVIELQVENKNMNEMNTLTAKANHQELICKSNGIRK